MAVRVGGFVALYPIDTDMIVLFADALRVAVKVCFLGLSLVLSSSGIENRTGWSTSTSATFPALRMQSSSEDSARPAVGPFTCSLVSTCTPQEIGETIMEFIQ